MKRLELLALVRFFKLPSSLGVGKKILMKYKIISLVEKLLKNYDERLLGNLDI